MVATMPGRKLRWVIIAVCLTFFSPAHADSQKRVALVVGVGHYANAGTLPNPPNDAQLIAATLADLHFQVQTVIDPDSDALAKAVREFGRRLDGATVALFYYAGHGIEVAGKNYLLPTNAALVREQDLRFEALDVQAVLDEMNDTGRISLVFLDACRDNPLARSLASHMGARSAFVGQGLAAEDARATGTLIAYATAPGGVAADGDAHNSPFATALAKNIVTPGLDVSQMIRRVRADVLQATSGKQIPWASDSLVSGFTFVPKPADPPKSDSVTSLPATSADVVFWQSIANSTSSVELEAYLQQFPQGIYAGLARARMASLTAKPAPSPAPEPMERVLTSAERQAVQAALSGLGFYRDKADLPSAIRQWQAFTGLTETAWLTQAQQDRLLDDSRQIKALLAVPAKSPRGTASGSVTGTDARLNRALDFELGDNQVKDAAEAAYWYALAADAGSATAFTNLGTLYARGQGMSRSDLNAARRLWLTAAALGEGAAMFNLGWLAEKGLGMTADLAVARGWYTKGVERKNAESGAALRRMGG